MDPLNGQVHMKDIEAPPPVPHVEAHKHVAAGPTIIVDHVSRWYGEILGINRVNVEIHPGITGLVGPNGSGKSTLMNIICGMLRPGQGSVTVLGQAVWNNPELMRLIGYCSQVDHFYENFTGRQFIESMLALHGRGREWTRRTGAQALEMVAMSEHQDRRLRAYSKGMRQRIKIALALAHQPEVLVLDEPFNGLDPVGRREMMELFADYARQGRTIILSSHILHEIEQMTDHILMMSNGYVLAEGQVTHVRDLLRSHPFQVFLRCSEPRRLAAIMLQEENVSSVQIEDERSLTLMTRDPDAFYLRLNDTVVASGIDIDVVTLADENVQSIYTYLAGKEHH
jgi:ABC-2 type transport system ATP-binding protein